MHQQRVGRLRDFVGLHDDTFRLHIRPTLERPAQLAQRGNGGGIVVRRRRRAAGRGGGAHVYRIPRCSGSKKRGKSESTRNSPSRVSRISSPSSSASFSSTSDLNPSR